MITKFKIFENSTEYDINKIEYELRKKFDSEEDFEEWCCGADDKDDFEDVDLSIIAQYDVPILLDLPPNDPKLHEILVELLTKIDFDEYYQPRDIDVERWETKNAVKKYNL